MLTDLITKDRALESIMKSEDKSYGVCNFKFQKDDGIFWWIPEG